MGFRFTKDHVAFFSSGQAAEILHEYRSQTEKYSDSLRIQTGLRAVFPALDADVIRACMEQFSLQDRGREKCSLPASALYTQEALEMASSAAAARLHASLLPEGGTLLEIAAGIGADSVHLAQRSDGLICIEADEVHARMLQHNLDGARRRNALILRGSAERWLPLLRLDRISGVFADPSRREGSQRSTEVEDYSPPFSTFDRFPSSLPLLIKIAPGANIPEGWDFATVAAGKECSEILLHRNIGLPSACALHADKDVRWVPGAPVDPLQVLVPRYLIEPHAAIIRTGEVAQYLREHGAEPLDPQIAYGLSETEPAASVWHQSFKLFRLESFNRKKLRRIAHELDFSPTTEIKKRGFPDSPEKILHELKLTGSTRGVIILSRRGQGHIMAFGKRIHTGTTDAIPS